MKQTGDEFDLGPGLMKPIDPKDVQGYYVEFEHPDEASDQPEN